MIITGVHAREVLDSRGNPTVEADVELDNKFMGRAFKDRERMPWRKDSKIQPVIKN